MIWEYKVQWFARDTGFVQALDELGRGGWELVQFEGYYMTSDVVDAHPTYPEPEPNMTSGYVCIFKRRNSQAETALAETQFLREQLAVTQDENKAAWLKMQKELERLNSALAADTMKRLEAALGEHEALNKQGGKNVET